MLVSRYPGSINCYGNWKRDWETGGRKREFITWHDHGNALGKGVRLCSKDKHDAIRKSFASADPRGSLCNNILCGLSEGGRVRS